MIYDVAIIGAGTDILSGASKGNSAMLHTGYDGMADSLELACVRAGYAEYMEIHRHLNLPLLETGGLLVAWNDAEAARLPAILAEARRNGLTDVYAVDAAELRRREPHLGPDALAAVVIPGEHIIDPWSPSLSYVLQGIAHGGEVRRRCAVTGGDRTPAGWRLATSGGPVEAAVVVNAAGNYGDLVEAIARPSPFRIRPRKGQFVVFDKPAARLIRSSILPVPTERTKGVMVVRTAFGNVIVGPTAEDQDDRADAGVDSAQLATLIEKGCRILPALAGETVTATYAGLRPATQFKDYQIDALPDRNWITVGGIRSTGLTGALGIAQHVAGLYSQHFGRLAANQPPIWTPVPNLAEHVERPYQKAGYGEIVCHCELVTRSEIEAALAGPLPAGDVGGLKRRTRCMMGRCQGFYCSARVAELTGDRLPELPAGKAA